MIMISIEKILEMLDRNWERSFSECRNAFLKRHFEKWLSIIEEKNGGEKDGRWEIFFPQLGVRLID